MDEMNSIHAKAYFNLLKTAGWIEERIKMALKTSGLTHAQLNVLYVLYQNSPKPVSPGFIKDKIIVSNPDITRLIDRLVQKGFVDRATCPENRRKIDITLTEPGHRKFMEAHLSAKEALDGYFAEKLTEKDAIELRRLMHLIRS